MPTITPTYGTDPFASMNALVAGCQTLLDVGAGIGQSVAAMAVPVKIGIDIHRPYLENWPQMNPAAIPLNLSANVLHKVFLPKTVDAVSFIDSLEHLTPVEARTALSDAERIARRVVLVFTPSGSFPQQDYDAWGLGGERFQRHHSTWQPEDFTALGYDVLVHVAFHNETNEAFRRAFGPGAPPVDALLAYKRLV